MNVAALLPRKSISKKSMKVSTMVLFRVSKARVKAHGQRDFDVVGVMEIVYLLTPGGREVGPSGEEQ